MAVFASGVSTQTYGPSGSGIDVEDASGRVTVHRSRAGLALARRRPGRRRGRARWLVLVVLAVVSLVALWLKVSGDGTRRRSGLWEVDGGRQASPTRRRSLRLGPVKEECLLIVGRTHEGRPLAHEPLEVWTEPDGLAEVTLDADGRACLDLPPGVEAVLRPLREGFSPPEARGRAGESVLFEAAPQCTMRARLRDGSGRPPAGEAVWRPPGGHAFRAPADEAAELTGTCGAPVGVLLDVGGVRLGLQERLVDGERIVLVPGVYRSVVHL